MGAGRPRVGGWVGAARNFLASDIQNNCLRYDIIQVPSKSAGWIQMQNHIVWRSLPTGHQPQRNVVESVITAHFSFFCDPGKAMAVPRSRRRRRLAAGPARRCSAVVVHRSSWSVAHGRARSAALRVGIPIILSACLLFFGWPTDRCK